MSHFSQVKTKLSDAVVLKKALTKLGLEVVEDEEGQKVRGFFGETQDADFKVLTSTDYDIGFKLVDGNYEVVGDWDLLPKVSKIDRDPFLVDLKKEYATQAIFSLAEQNGYGVEYHQEGEQIEMVVTKW